MINTQKRDNGSEAIAIFYIVAVVAMSHSIAQIYQLGKAYKDTYIHY